jgi:hypothetical protein
MARNPEQPASAGAPAEGLVNEHEAARRLGMKVSTLRRWRWQGIGPIFCRIGAAVRYDPRDLNTFIEASRRCSTSVDRLVSDPYA